VTDDIDSGITRLPSSRSVDDTTERIQEFLQTKGLKVFCVVDHSGEAARVGLAMRPTRLILFGSPSAGTPVMVESPSAALDLPLKALVSEDATGNVSVAFNRPDYLQHRHRIPDDLIGNISGAGALLRAAIQ
jgi:uncharacterized protein (DUF302 family)